MYYPDRIKQAPMTGLAGFGGGASGLGTAGAAVLPFINGGDRGIWAGGTPSGYYWNVIGYRDITSTGNASEFGEMTSARGYHDGCSSGTRGCWAGGYSGSYVVNIDYITISSTGNAGDFGDLTSARSSLMSTSSDVRGLWLGGDSNVIDYVTLASTGNATDFGDTSSNATNGGACSNGVIALLHVGAPGGTPSNVLEYVTIATTGNMTDFGDLSSNLGSQDNTDCIGNNVYGLIWSGTNSSGKIGAIDRISLASTGNASDFGDMSVATHGGRGCTNGTRAIYAGGWASSIHNVMQYVEMDTPGNASDFGDLTHNQHGPASCSGAPS
tara:strand:+ start:999 stop:1976 length:978 start_codon:yes stop_codon:yes gene_type:complete